MEEIILPAQWGDISTQTHHSCIVPDLCFPFNTPKEQGHTFMSKVSVYNSLHHQSKVWKGPCLLLLQKPFELVDQVAYCEAWVARLH